MFSSLRRHSLRNELSLSDRLMAELFACADFLNNNFDKSRVRLSIEDWFNFSDTGVE